MGDMIVLEGGLEGYGGKRQCREVKLMLAFGQHWEHLQWYLGADEVIQE